MLGPTNTLLFPITQMEREEAECEIYQRKLDEAEQLGLTLSYFDLDEVLSDVEDEEDEGGLLVEVEAEHGDLQCKRREYTYRFPVDNPLLAACRIVHSIENNKLCVSYRASSGQHFQSKEELLSFMETKNHSQVNELQNSFNDIKPSITSQGSQKASTSIILEPECPSKDLNEDKKYLEESSLTKSSQQVSQEHQEPISSLAIVKKKEN